MGTMTINTTSPEDSRLQVAFGAYLSLGRNATGPEIKAAIIAWIVAVVKNQETVAQEQAISVTTIAPT